MSYVYNLLLLIDGVIYTVVDYLFNIFYFFTQTNLFDRAEYKKIVTRIYIILGLVMLFVLAYSLLKAIINPDNFSKGENSFPKLIQNIITSLIIIVILPTIFSFAYSFQNTILNYQTIPKIILGTNGTKAYDNMGNFGHDISYILFTSFLYPNEEWCDDNNYVFDPIGKKDTCSDKITSNKGWFWGGDKNFADVSKEIKDSADQPENSQLRSLINFNQFGQAVAEGKLSYTILISTIVGIALLIVVANFCFDMAVRVIRLMFFQIVAPIPVICRVIPGGKMKDVFSTWVKKITNTFIDVFIRIGVICLAIYLINIITNSFDDLQNISLLSFPQQLIAKALLIMAVVIFMQEAPKLIGDIFHLDVGNMKLGITDKLAKGGFFAAGGAVGSLITSRGNPFAAIRGFKYGMKNKDFRVVGQEGNYRLAKQEAYQNGATRRGIFLDRMRRNFGFDTSYERNVRAVDTEISNIKDGQLAGNDGFLKAADNMKTHVEKKIEDSKSTYETSITYEREVEYDTGMLDHNGNHIMATKKEMHTETGNLCSLKQFLNSNAKNMSTAEITKFNQALNQKHDDLYAQYIKDNVLQTKDAAGNLVAGAKDKALSNYINTLQTSLNGVLMDENGVSQLSEEARNSILRPDNGDLASAIDTLKGDVQDAADKQNIRIMELNTQKQETSIRYRAQSDVATKPIGEQKPKGDGRRPPRGPHGPGPGSFGPGPGGF